LWREFLSQLSDSLALRPGCPPAQLADTEARLGVRLPSDLADLLSETDGFFDTESQYDYAWDHTTIVAENTLHWLDNDAPLDRDLLAFGGDGGGGWFCLSHTRETTASVYHWDWIDGERRLIAPDLRAFWRGWLTGSIGV
jgi:hypothetical protein